MFDGCHCSCAATKSVKYEHDFQWLTKDLTMVKSQENNVMDGNWLSNPHPSSKTLEA